MRSFSLPALSVLSPIAPIIDKIHVPQTDLLIRNTKCEEFGSPQIKEVQFTDKTIDKLLEI